MNFGQIVLNGVTDQQLDYIIRVMEQHEQTLHFDPSQSHRAAPPPYQPPPCPFPHPFPYPPPMPPAPPAGQNIYDNVVITCTGDDGIAALIEVLRRINPNIPVPPGLPPLPN